MQKPWTYLGKGDVSRYLNGYVYSIGRFIAFRKEKLDFGCLNPRACGVQGHLFLLGR